MDTRERFDVVVIGGGPAGLATAARVAQGGRTVLVLEAAEDAGGRARSVALGGVPVNLGPHALYRAGHAARVLSSLGVRPRGFVPPAGGCAVHGGALHALPATAGSILATHLLAAGEKLEAAAFFARLSAGAVRVDDGTTLGAWLATFSSPRVRDVLRTFIRVSTYAFDDALDARAALAQLRLATKGVTYVDGGWRTIVDGLRAAAVARGVVVRTGVAAAAVERAQDRRRHDHDGGDDRRVPARADGVGGDGATRTYDDGGDDEGGGATRVRLADGSVVYPGRVVLAVPPRAASKLLGGALDDVVDGLRPITAACLDLVVDALPEPSRRFALGIDAPLYFSVHSRAGASPVVVHAMQNGGGSRADLHALLDLVQPGAVVRGARFFPSLTVSHAMPVVGARFLPQALDDVLLVGDAVAGEGMLLDRALFTAEAAARRVLGDGRRANDGAQESTTWEGGRAIA
jgi:hypothetical protein